MSQKFTTVIGFTFLILQLISTTMFSATNGSIKGTIRDANSKEPLPYSNVFLKGTSLGNASDKDGDYLIQNIPAGTYTLRASFIGYKQEEISVEIVDGKTTQYDFYLSAESMISDTLIVTAQAIGQMEAINEQLSSSSIKNVVSSARIQEVPDANAAESVGRLPGVSVLREGGEGNKVVIRGLAPQYNNVTIDGVKLGGTGLSEHRKTTASNSSTNNRSDMAFDRTTDRSADLSMISPNMLEGIEVVKAITPDMDADVLGGSVNFKIKEASPGMNYDFTAQGGYNNLKKSSNDYKLVANFDTRLFDNKFGILVQGNLERRNRSSNELGASYSLQGPVLGQFNQPLISGLTLSDINRDKDRKGAIVVLDYRLPNGKISSTNLYSHTKTSSLDRSETYDINANVKYYDITESLSKIDILTNTLEYEGDFSSLHVEAKLAHTYSENNDPENYYVNFYQNQAGLNNVNRKVAPSQVPSYIRLDTSKTYLNDLRVYTNGSKDREYSGKLDLTYPLRFSDLVTGKVKFGGKYGYKNRSYGHTEEGGNLGLGSGSNVKEQILVAYPWMRGRTIEGAYFPIGLFWDSNVDFGNFLEGDYPMVGKESMGILKEIIKISQKYGNLESWSINDVSNTRSNYKGNEYSTAGYAMVDLNIGSQIEFIPGFRYESLTTSYTAPHGNSAYGSASTNYPHIDTTADKTNGYFLPMIHLRYKPLSWFDVRLAYTNTLSYPDFSAIIPLLDIGTNRVMWNNPNLKAGRSQNFDIYMSFYENSLGLFTIGGFYKEIKDLVTPWNNRIIEDASQFEGVPSYTKGYYIDTYINNPNKATVKGLELDWQTHFWYLPGVLSGFVLNVNYTHIKSEAKYPLTKYQVQYLNHAPWVQTTIVDTFYTNRMLDQPDDIVNVSLGFDYEGFSINVSMIYQADIFKSTNFWQELRGSTEKYTRFDISAKQDLPFYNTQVFCNLNNLNRAKDISLIQGNGFPSTEQHYDMTVDFGLRLRL